MRTTRLAALLFVELAGFPDLLARAEGPALGLLAEFRALAEPLLPEHGGQLIDANGEELLIVFESAVAAVQYGLHLFLAAGSRNASPGRGQALVLRAGVHLGEIWQDEARVYGNGVNIASRIKAEAEPGSLLVSEDVYRQISNKLDLFARELPARGLKNIERPLLLYELLAAPPPDAAAPKPAAQAPAAQAPAAQAPAAQAPAAGPPTPEAPAEKPRRSKAEGADGGAQPSKRLRPPLPPPPRPPRPPRPRIRIEDRGGGSLHLEVSSPARKTPRGGSPARRREAAKKELVEGLGKFLGAGALCAGLVYAYSRNESLWLALSALFLGLFPSMSGLKKFLRASLDLREARRDERGGSAE